MALANVHSFLSNFVLFFFKKVANKRMKKHTLQYLKVADNLVIYYLEVGRHLYIYLDKNVQTVARELHLGRPIYNDIQARHAICSYLFCTKFLTDFSSTATSLANSKSGSFRRANRIFLSNSWHQSGSLLTASSSFLLCFPPMDARESAAAEASRTSSILLKHLGRSSQAVQS